jgi:hypothetical protein
MDFGSHRDPILVSYGCLSAPFFVLEATLSPKVFREHLGAYIVMIVDDFRSYAYWF